MSDWPFDDAPNTACIATSFVLDGSPILRVYHDFDGGWQFHGDDTQSCDQDDAKMVSLSSMVDRDKSLSTLHDLPYGWLAYRNQSNAKWTREKDHPFPTFDDDKYYLEDAEWLAEFFDDIDLPNDDVRRNLDAGDFVKLVFRFRPEAAERQDNECERMWVQITEYDDDNEIYTGKLDNDPHHDGAVKCGDQLCFHPSHIMAIHTDSGA